jgi:hypothetical protein
MLEMINQDKDMKISFKCNAAHQLLLGLSLNNIAPNVIWMCSFIDYLSLNTIVLSSLIHHLIIFHCPLADLNTTCFPSQGPLYCPQMVNFSRSVKKCWRHSCQGFCKFDRCSYLTIILVLESNLIFKRLCLFKSNCLNEIREMLLLKSIFER